jgi:hypothetical protein
MPLFVAFVLFVVNVACAPCSSHLMRSRFVIADRQLLTTDCSLLTELAIAGCCLSLLSNPNYALPITAGRFPAVAADQDIEESISPAGCEP